MQDVHHRLGGLQLAPNPPPPPPPPPAPAQQLNDEQRAVVDHPADSPLLVLACAGTGKTTTLMHRTATLLRRVRWPAGRPPAAGTSCCNSGPLARQRTTVAHHASKRLRKAQRGALRGLISLLERLQW